MGSMPVGRGRGRQLYSIPLRRPGNPQNEPEYFQCMLVLSPTFKNQPDNVLRALEKQIKAVCKVSSEMREFFDKVYQKSLQDKQFGMIAAFYVSKLIMAEVEGFRKMVLDKLQYDYEMREEMCKKQSAWLINFTSFMGHVYAHVVLRNGLPLRVLSKPIVSCLAMLLSPVISETEVFTEQILLNGEKMSEFVPEELSSLILKARALLTEQTCNQECSLLLLLAIEAEARKFVGFPATVADFYIAEVKSIDVKAALEKINSKLTSVTTSTIEIIENATKDTGTEAATNFASTATTTNTFPTNSGPVPTNSSVSGKS